MCVLSCYCVVYFLLLVQLTIPLTIHVFIVGHLSHYFSTICIIYSFFFHLSFLLLDLKKDLRSKTGPMHRRLCLTVYGLHEFAPGLPEYSKFMFNAFASIDFQPIMIALSALPSQSYQIRFSDQMVQRMNFSKH